MDRKLASIQKIVNIEPIPDADNIEKCTVLGWECIIAKKDNFKIGDKIIYIEVDSIVPDKPEFEFLRQRKFRVRTIKLKKQISQGLVLPLSILPKRKKEYQEDEDVTKILEIRKYDPAGDLENKLALEQVSKRKGKINRFLSRYPWYRRLFMPSKMRFPKFIEKTDETRIQKFPNICEKEKDTIFSCTEKLHGQSGTYFLLKKPKFKILNFKFGKELLFGVCSRKVYLYKQDNSSYWTIAKQLNIREVLEKLIVDNEYVVIQGEIIGRGIEENKYKITGYDFYAFNMVYPDHQLDNPNAKKLLEEYGIKFVPILDNNFVLRSTIPEMVEYAKGKSTLLPVLREGIVVRNYERNISFKVINPEFLLKNEE